MVMANFLCGTKKVLISRQKKRIFVFIAFVIDKKNMLNVKMFCNVIRKHEKMDKEGPYHADNLVSSNEVSYFTQQEYISLKNWTFFELKPYSQRRERFAGLNQKYVGTYGGNCRLPP